MANGTLRAHALDQTGVLSLETHAEARALSGRIEGYDVARAFAVFGMVLVNFQLIFSEYSFYTKWYNELFDLIFGRAAVLFVMLAGAGLSLMSRRAYIFSDAEGLQKVRRSLLKRSLILLFAGLIFMNWWNADILHFYGIFLAAGSFFLAVPPRRLIGAAIFIFLISAFVYCVSDGNGFTGMGAAASGLLAGIVDDLFFSGYYSIFPWFGFLLIGMWIGRRGPASDPVSGLRLLIWAAAVFAGIQLALEYLPVYFIEYIEESESSVVDMFLTLEVFPVTPLYSLSAVASSIIVIVLAFMMTRYRAFARISGYLANAGRLTLTIYISHIFIGFAVQRFIISDGGDELHRNMTIYFPFVFCIMTVVFSNLWLRHFESGPLEWVLRRCSK